jgi:hypothetical protein
MWIITLTLVGTGLGLGLWLGIDWSHGVGNALTDTVESALADYNQLAQDLSVACGAVDVDVEPVSSNDASTDSTSARRVNIQSQTLEAAPLALTLAPTGNPSTASPSAATVNPTFSDPGTDYTLSTARNYERFPGCDADLTNTTRHGDVSVLPTTIIQEPNVYFCIARKVGVFSINTTLTVFPTLAQVDQQSQINIQDVLTEE